MRCYFIRNGRIAAVEELPGLEDEEAVVQANSLYLDRKRLYDGFEVWDRTRFLIRYPEVEGDRSLENWHSQ
jgi:hypothetical protein